MLGNDDPKELRSLLDEAPWGVHDEGQVVMLDDDHEMISLGYSNITPWHSHREMTEDQLAAAIGEMAAKLQAPERSIVNVHVPPYGIGLDEAPMLDDTETRDVLRAMRETVPLSRTMGERFEALRSWARTRARPASAAGRRVSV